MPAQQTPLIREVLNLHPHRLAGAVARTRFDPDQDGIWTGLGSLQCCSEFKAVHGTTRSS